MNEDLIVSFVEKLIDTLLPDNLVTGGYGIIIKNAYGSASSTLSGLDTFVSSLIPLAIMLLALRWTSQLLTEVLSKDFDIELIIRSFIRLVIGAVIITNSVALFNGIVTFGEKLLVDLQSVISISNPPDLFAADFTELIDSVRDKSWGTSLSGVVICMVLMAARGILSVVTIFVIYVAGFTRTITLAQMFLFCPIGLSDIYQGGMQSGGVKFARKFLAIVLEPIIVYIAVCAYVNLATDTSYITWSMFVPWFKFVLLAALLGFIRKARKFSQSIFC